MPFDCTPPDPSGEHDPAPTWGKRAACRAVLACYCTTLGAGVLAMIALFAWALVTKPVVAALWTPVFGWTLWLLWSLRLDRRDLLALAAGRWP